MRTIDNELLQTVILIDTHSLCKPNRIIIITTKNINFGRSNFLVSIRENKHPRSKLCSLSCYIHDARWRAYK